MTEKQCPRCKKNQLARVLNELCDDAWHLCRSNPQDQNRRKNRLVLSIKKAQRILEGGESDG